MNEPEKIEILDVLVIGTGFSGVCAGIELLQRDIHNFRIYDKTDGIGGTWYDNTYPGAACDVPSHFYCYSFEPNPNWSRVYSPQVEIQQYIESCVDKYQLRPHIVHGAKVVEMRLDEAASVWDVTFEDGSVVKARHIINGYGGLHKPSIPDFKGKESFSGVSMHTAQWDHEADFTGKRVAIIGSAASAIQIIPELAKVVSQLTIFQRTPNYIAPRGDRKYTQQEKQRFARWPRLQRLYRWMIYKRMDLLLFPVTKRGSKAGRTGARKVKEHMRASVKDASLHQHLEPSYEMGCKRILLSDNLFHAINKDNVELVCNGVSAIEPAGVRCGDGQLREVDIIVYATGFDIDGHMRSVQVCGQNGKSLQDEWREGPEAFCGSSIAGFPNYWMVTGPNTGVGTTSVVYMIEEMIKHIMRMIEASAFKQLVNTKRSSQDSYNAEISAALDNTVWASGCDSYYITENGKITTLYPYNASAFRRQLASVRVDDFEFKGVD